jgi:hypothetical protein
VGGEMKGITHKTRKWIEFAWLRRGHKEIPLPEVIFEEIETGGLYYHPDKKEVLINGVNRDLSKGLIIIDPNHNDKFVLNTIVHEWRHHWQYFQGFNMGLVGAPYRWRGNYKSEIQRFFKLNKIEMDALLFAIKKAPDDISLEWMEWVTQR